VSPRTQRLAATLVCLLALAGCSDRSAPGQASTPDDASSQASPRLPPIAKLPGDFPLTAGWPDRLRTPTRTSLTLPGCGDGSGLPPNPNGTDRLSAHWNGAARHRQLTTYDDDTRAASVVRRMMGFYRGCPVVVSQELPWRTITSVRPAAVGEESWVVVQSLEVEGREAGATVLLVARVGRAVLVDQIGFGGDGSRLGQEVERQTSRAVSVLGAMCVLPQNDC
jgi:hypothetical protein